MVPAAAATIGEEAAVIADLIRAQHDSANDGVADVGVRTILLRPVIYVTTALDAEDVVGVERLSARLAGTLAAPGGAGEPLGYYVRILSAGGDIVGTLSYTDERWSLGGPPAPTDVAELSSWLSSVYGASGPQRWLGAIRDIREPSSDPEGLIRIETALDPSSASDLADAQTIIDAVNSSGARFAPGVRLVFGDGEFEWTALTDGVDPFGPSAP